MAKALISTEKRGFGAPPTVASAYAAGRPWLADEGAVQSHHG